MRRMTKIDEKKGLEGKIRKFIVLRENFNEGFIIRCYVILLFCFNCFLLIVFVLIILWVVVE